MVLQLTAAEVVGVSEVGARILELVDGRATVATIAEILTREYEVDPTEAERDTLDFLTRLVDAELVEPAGEVR